MPETPETLETPAVAVVEAAEVGCVIIRAIKSLLTQLEAPAEKAVAAQMAALIMEILAEVGLVRAKAVVAAPQARLGPLEMRVPQQLGYVKHLTGALAVLPETAAQEAVGVLVARVALGLDADFITAVVGAVGAVAVQEVMPEVAAVAQVLLIRAAPVILFFRFPPLLHRGAQVAPPVAALEVA